MGTYVKEGIDFTVRNDLTIMNKKLFESIFIDITCSNKSLTYGMLYRSPNMNPNSNSEFLKKLNEYLQKITKKINLVSFKEILTIIYLM